MRPVPSQLALDETQTYNSRSSQKSLTGVGNSAKTPCGVIALRELPGPCESLDAGERWNSSRLSQGT